MSMSEEMHHCSMEMCRSEYLMKKGTIHSPGEHRALIMY